MGRLDGKVVVMTGTSQGLGAEAMKLFAREGAAVVGTARRENKVQEVIDELRKEKDYPLLAMHHDVTSREDWDKRYLRDDFDHLYDQQGDNRVGRDDGRSGTYDSYAGQDTTSRIMLFTQGRVLPAQAS